MFVEFFPIPDPGVLFASTSVWSAALVPYLIVFVFIGLGIFVAARGVGWLLRQGKSGIGSVLGGGKKGGHRRR
jgi:hypothetical protein